MRIISDITGKEYKTVELCLADEKAFEEKKAKEEAAAKELAEKKDAAYKKAIDACEEYLKLCGVEVEFTDNGYIIRKDETDGIFDDVMEILDILW